MACTVEANGTTVTCACSGCGIAYNHETKKYHVLCCGTIFEMDLKLDTDTDTGPGKGLSVHLSGVELLEAAQLIERADPGKVKVSGSLKSLGKRVSMKAAGKPTSTVTKKLKLGSAR